MCARQNSISPNLPVFGYFEEAFLDKDGVNGVSSGSFQPYAGRSLILWICHNRYSPLSSLFLVWKYWPSRLHWGETVCHSQVKEEAEAS